MPDIFTLAFTSFAYHNIPIYILAIRRDVIFTRHAKVYLVPRLHGHGCICMQLERYPIFSVAVYMLS